jgi:hypothetical protein
MVADISPLKRKETAPSDQFVKAQEKGECYEHVLFPMPGSSP